MIILCVAPLLWLSFCKFLFIIEHSGQASSTLNKVLNHVLTIPFLIPITLSLYCPYGRFCRPNECSLPAPHRGYHHRRLEAASVERPGLPQQQGLATPCFSSGSRPSCSVKSISSSGLTSGEETLPDCTPRAR